MGREQKRKTIKIAKKNGIPKSVAELYFSMKLHGSLPNTFNEGDKVRLNIEAIKKHQDYPKLTRKYHDFIDSHADDVFTIKKDNGRKDTNTLVCLAEDKDGWLFWTGNLTLVERNNDENNSED